MAYIGQDIADVAVTVGQGVIDASHIQDATITTADLGNDAITPNKIDDDGTGFQMGSLGIGTAVSGSHKLVVGGSATFSGDITGTLATASQGNITSVGTLTGLTTGAITQNAGVLTIKNASSDSNGLRIFQDSSDASKIYNNYNGTLQLGVGNTTALTIDSSENSTFAGDVNVQSDGARFFVKSADYELVSVGRAGSSGSALDQGYIRMKNAGTNTIALHSASNSYLTNGLSIGTSSMNSNAVVHIRGGDSGQSSSSNNTQLTVENSGTAGIQLLTGTSNVGGIWVGDSNGSETGGKLYYSNNDDSWQFYNQGSNNGLTITANGLVQCKRGFTNGQALDIEGEAFGRTNSSSVAFGYRQDGNGVLFKLQKSSTDVFQIVNSGRVHQEISESEAYAASFENTSSGGYGLRVYGGASSADYLIRGLTHGGTDKFAVKSSGRIERPTHRDNQGTFVINPDGSANDNWLITLTGLNYGFANIRIGAYGHSSYVNIDINLGGHMASGGTYYNANVITNESSSDIIVTLTQNQTGYIVKLSNNTNADQVYGHYQVIDGGYTGNATVTVQNSNT